jgi:hypothetical protein
MTFILGIGVGVLLTVGYALLSVASDADDAIDDAIDNHTDFR